MLEKYLNMLLNKMIVDWVLEESDLEEIEFMLEKSILIIENEIEEMKINMFKFFEKNFYIFLDINGYFNEEGFFDEDFVQVVFDLERYSFVLDYVSLEINYQFEIEFGDMFV